MPTTVWEQYVNYFDDSVEVVSFEAYRKRYCFILSDSFSVIFDFSAIIGSIVSHWGAEYVEGR